MRRTIIWTLAFLIFPLVPAGVNAGVDEIKRYSAGDIKLDYLTDETAFFSKPLSIIHDQEFIYIVDAEANTVWIHSKTGAFQRQLGRKGAGPGEFDYPTDMDICRDKIYVVDSFNRRIQILDKKGDYLGGFKVPFIPDQICAFAGGKIIVSHLPLGVFGSEPMIHCFSEKGEILWEKMESLDSPEKVYATFRNLLAMIKGAGDDVYIIRKYEERTILRFNTEGKVLSGIPVSDRLAFKEAALPIESGPRTVRSFCWDAALGLGRLAVLAPDFAKENDISPGRQVYLIEPSGNIQAMIDLPSEVGRMDMDGDRMYAIDTESRLRIFSLQPR